MDGSSHTALPALFPNFWPLEVVSSGTSEHKERLAEVGSLFYIRKVDDLSSQMHRLSSSPTQQSYFPTDPTPLFVLCNRDFGVKF